MMVSIGWPACAQFNARGGCDVPAARQDDGTVVVDTAKFPESAPGMNDGIKVVADKVHSMGYKLGIYTAPHGQTCGGFWGMCVMCCLIPLCCPIVTRVCALYDSVSLCRDYLTDCFVYKLHTAHAGLGMR